MSCSRRFQDPALQKTPSIVFMLVKSLPSFVQTIIEFSVVISHHGDLCAECFETFLTAGSIDSFSRLVRYHLVREFVCRGPSTFICFCIHSIFSHHCDPSTEHLLEFIRCFCEEPNIVCKSQKRQPQPLIVKTQAPLSLRISRKRSSNIPILATKIAGAIGSPCTRDLPREKGRDIVSGFRHTVDFICDHSRNQASIMGFGTPFFVRPFLPVQK